MSAKKDYYEILGVPRSSTAEEIKKPTENLRSSTTPTNTRETRKPKRNSRKSGKPTRFFQISRNGTRTTGSDTVPLPQDQEWAERAASMIHSKFSAKSLAREAVVQESLGIFLKVLLVGQEEVAEEVVPIKGPTYATIWKSSSWKPSMAAKKKSPSGVPFHVPPATGQVLQLAPKPPHARPAVGKGRSP